MPGQGRDHIPHIIRHPRRPTNNNNRPLRTLPSHLCFQQSTDIEPLTNRDLDINIIPPRYISSMHRNFPFPANDILHGFHQSFGPIAHAPEELL